MDQADLDYTPVNGSFQVLVKNNRSNTEETSDVFVKLNGLNDDTTLNDLATALDAVDGISAVVTPELQLRVTSDSPETEFAFAHDTSGALAALELNIFFTGSAASNLGVSSVISQDATKFAASREGIATGATTAAELGILRTSGGGVSPLVGNDLNPRLLRTSSLDNLLGTQATAVLNSSGLNNDIFIEAVENGAPLSDVSIQFVTNNAAGDTALVTFDEGTKTLAIDITPGTTTAVTVVQAINDSGVFLANLDSKLDPNNDGSNVVDVAVSATTSGGAGIVFDRESGIQIAQGNETYSIAFDQAETVEDVLNILNTSAADLFAEISADGRGIDVRSRRSGADPSIGENGGTTASELGIRSFTAETRLNDLNYGRGVDTADGTDFIIQRKDGVELEIDISDALTINDVIERINNQVDNTGDAVQARLAVHDNGIELYDENAAGTETLTVRRAKSFAVWDRDSWQKQATKPPQDQRLQPRRCCSLHRPTNKTLRFS